MDRRAHSRSVKTFPALAAILLVGIPAAPLAGQANGETLFHTTCAACHSVGTDRLIGPGLGGVSARRDRDWLVSFITEPDRMISESDSLATSLLAEYQVPMPNLGIAPDQAVAILDYLGSVGGSAAVATLTPLAPSTPEQVRLGRALFEGSTRFTNGGPSCNACHNVTDESVVAGGSLAIDLTGTWSRLGGPGVQAMLTTPPFPAMRRAFADRPLTEEEVAGLAAFLQEADARQGSSQPVRHGTRLFGLGVGGSILLMGLYSIAWRGRRRESVSRTIYDRQGKSI